MAEAVFKHVVAQHKLTSRFKIDRYWPSSRRASSVPLRWFG